MKKILAILLAAVLMLTGCSATPTTEELLADTWYKEGSQDMAFELYSDGTCKIANVYGTGKWSVVNDNQLKLVNYYGESQVADIAEISEGKLVISANGSSITYVNTAG